jgi:hypothetical protein
MSITLADAFLKTTRAKVHLDSLRNEVAIFRDSKPHRVTRERDITNRRFLIHFKIANIPDGLYLIVGDFLYCMRSSLDQLVWSLAKLNKPYPRGTQFPILEKRNEKKFLGDTKGMPVEARHIIESLQPYNAGQSAVKNHLLWKLNKLSNIDKHRRIPIHSDVSMAYFPDLPRKFGRLLKVDNEGTVSVPLNLESYMRIQKDASFSIIFGDVVEGVECDIEGLEQIYDFVTFKALPRFTRFFQHIGGTPSEPNSHARIES